MLDDSPSRQVQSVRTAFRVINIVQDLGRATPTQLTDRLDLSKSSVHNYLTTLEQIGYVVNDKGKYRLGLRFLTHGMAAKNSLGIEAPIVQQLESIADKLELSTWWVAEEFGRGLFLEDATPGEQTTIYGSVGKRSYLHTHALGKAILARFPDEYVTRIVEYHGLAEQTTKTTTDPDVLVEEIDEIRDQGYAVSDGEAALGIISIGAGFLDASGRSHAVGIFGDSREITNEQTNVIGEQIRQSASSLEESLVTGGE